MASNTKHLNLLLVALLALAAGSAQAQTQAQSDGAAAATDQPAATPPYTLAFNVGAVTDYRYRGISQSHLDPALQGGVDFTHSSGFYLGAWASSIRWIKDAGATDGSMELDLYGGYRGQIGKDWSYDLGYLRYQYPSNTLGRVNGFADANTDELYAAATWRIVTLKYSRSLSNLFGTPSSTGSGYLDLSANVDLGGGWSLTPHVGRQTVANNGALSYTDYALTVGRDFGHGLSASLAVIGTDANQTLYATPQGRFTGRTALVAGVKYSF